MSRAELRTSRPFSFDELFEHPGFLGPRDRSRRRKKVCVLGGGPGGLVAAHELAKLNHGVVVLEASNRPGGRVRTHAFPDGSRGELGPMRIPTNHHGVLHYVREFNLETRRFVNFNPRAKYLLRGELALLEDWRRLLDVFGLKGVEREDPRLLYEKSMKNAMAFLKSSDKWAIFAAASPEARVPPRVVVYDNLSLREYLRTSFSEDAMEWMGHATGMRQYERASLLEALLDFFGLYNVDQVELVGGMEALPRALAGSLGDKVRYRARATRIEVTAQYRVRVHWLQDRTPYSDVFDHVICCLPAPAVDQLEFAPDLPYQQRQALRAVSYASAAKTLVHCSQRPWEFEDGIFGGGSFTDELVQQVWYPSDNSINAGDGPVVSFTGNETRSRYSTAPLHFRALDTDTSRTAGVLTGAYMWEANARRFSALSESQKTATVLKTLETMHPGIERYVDDVVHHSWDASESPGGGAFAYFAPGDHQRYKAWLRAAYPREHPRVFFAGEHLGAHAWIQGAVQTALDAVVEVIAADPPLGESVAPAPLRGGDTP